jgi:hypothetical protein
MDNSDLFADTGDGFGNNGTGGARIALDTEGLGKVLLYLPVTIYRYSKLPVLTCSI